LGDYFMHTKAAFLCLSDTVDPLEGFSNFADPFPKSVSTHRLLGTFKVGMFTNKTVTHCANLYRVSVKIYYSIFVAVITRKLRLHTELRKEKTL